MARLLMVVAACLLALKSFIHNGSVGGDDARWYTVMVADFIEQWRAGAGPVFVGQTEYAAVGTVFPLRVAPYLQHLSLALDFVTGQSLAPYNLLNLALLLSACAGGVSAYLCLATLLKGRRLEASLLAVLYIWCPAVMGLAYTGQLFMSAMTWPYLPLVFAGVARICQGGGLGSWLMMVTGAAACLICHSPIGVWATVAAATALLVWWLMALGMSFVSRREGRGWQWPPGSHPFLVLKRGAAAALIGLPLCAYVFVSLRSLEVPPSAPLGAETIVAILKTTLPGIFLRIDGRTHELSALQLGYAMSFLLAASLVITLAMRLRDAAGIAAVVLLLVLLLVPVTGVSSVLWSALPQAVRDVTNAAAGQRLFPVLSAAASVLTALAIRSWTEGRKTRRFATIAVLIAGAGWSADQVHAFLSRGRDMQVPRLKSDQNLRTENLPHSRYSRLLLWLSDSYSSHGVMRFPLEQRILNQDLTSYVATNYGAIAPGFQGGKGVAVPRPPGMAFTAVPEPTNPTFIRLRPDIRIQPDQNYVLALEFGGPRPPQGVLQFVGTEAYREYLLPVSGEPHAFGALPEASRLIPLWISTETPEDMVIYFINQDPMQKPEDIADFVRYELIPYDPENLPVRLRSYIPYTADVTSPTAGWLETFRHHIPGWYAEVNGVRHEVRRTENGLVAAPIPQGESRVRVVYQPPALVLWSYWACLGSWFILATAVTITALSSRSRTRSTPSPAAS